MVLWEQIFVNVIVASASRLLESLLYHHQMIYHIFHHISIMQRMALLLQLLVVVDARCVAHSRLKRVNQIISRMSQKI